MPFLSWQQGDRLACWPLESVCILGRDPALCTLAFEDQVTLSKRHATLSKQGKTWWIRDEASKNGTRVNGKLVDALKGMPLQEGDEVVLGSMPLRYSTTFPCLNPSLFMESAERHFLVQEGGCPSSLVMLERFDLLQEYSEDLLKEDTAAIIMKRLLEAAVALLQAERGFLVMLDKKGFWQTVERIGAHFEHSSLCQSVLHYVARHELAVLSNAPLDDPRFADKGHSRAYCGPLMCVPLEKDEALQGMLYLDRPLHAHPFSRFDLSLLHTLIRQGALALRHEKATQQALRVAELEGEVMRLQSLNERMRDRNTELFVAMESCLHWMKSYGDRTLDVKAPALLHMVDRLKQLVESGIKEMQLEVPKDTPSLMALDALQSQLGSAWESLLEIRGASLITGLVPSGQVWSTAPFLPLAVSALVEPMLMRVVEGQQVQMNWQETTGNWSLRLLFPSSVHGPMPDTWTISALNHLGIVWRWVDQVLTLTFPRELENLVEAAPLPLLGLVTEEQSLTALFQSVAEADGLALFPLEEVPPLPPLPHFRYLVVDALGVKNVAACVQTYRRHPNFATAPILVVRAPEEVFSTLLAAGATDWLAEGFRWETLHHRLQVLKGHDELQRKALAAERLESFRQMAGSLKHEINNPLAIISMQVELLERRYPNEPKHAKIHEMVARIQALLQVLQKMRDVPLEGYPGGSTILKLR